MAGCVASIAVLDAAFGPKEQTCPGALFCRGQILRCDHRSRVAELPGACHVCGLTLVSSSHLAHSYHHMFPVRAFDEVPPADVARLAQVGRQTSAVV